MAIVDMLPTAVAPIPALGVATLDVSISSASDGEGVEMTSVEGEEAKTGATVISETGTACVGLRACEVADEAGMLEAATRGDEETVMAERAI